MADNGSLYFKQLLSGRDHARAHPFAGQMVNFAYLVGCKETKKCVTVDPTWDPRGIVEVAGKDGMRVVGAVATHAHTDHVGGTMMGIKVPGIRELAGLIDGPIHIHTLEAEKLKHQTGLDDDRLTGHDDGDVIEIGSVRIEIMLTPGHTPGGICLLFDGQVITGDVLFVGGCGRTDLPGANVEDMFHSLRRLSALPEKTIVWPGHDYGHANKSTIGEENRSNPVMGITSLDDWTRMMG